MQTYKKSVIILFFSFLIFPVLSFPFVKNGTDDTTFENRTLAEKPEFNWETLDTYPTQFEAYFNDHLPYKNQLVGFYQSANYQLFHEIPTNKVSLGKDNWLFYLGEPEEDPIADYQGTNLFTAEELKLIKSNLKKAAAYFEERGIEFILMVAPNKEQIYSEKMSNAYKIINEKKRYDLLISYLKANSDIRIIDPKEELLKEKENYQVYYQYDSHWNKLGAFIAAQQLRQELQGERDYLSEKSIKREEQISEDLVAMTNLPQYFDDDFDDVITDYQSDVSTELLEKSDDNFLIKYRSDAKDQRRLFIIRDSFGEGLIDYLSKDFAHTTFLHRNAYHINYVNEDHPDILVYEVVERNLDLLKEDGVNLISNE